MNKFWKYFLLLAWLSYLFVCGVLLFTRGFLLTRRSLVDRASCTENVDCSSYLKNSQEEPSALNTQLYLDCLDGDQLKLRQSEASVRCAKSNRRVVLILIDALRYDFARYNHSVKEEERQPFQNRLPIIDELLRTVPNNSLLFKFIANPPTTTMQRLKGLTTGSLPTFIDIGSNFAAAEIDEDNILDQLIGQEKNIVFMGDDTWTSLFPKRFLRQYPYPSFNVWDLDTVDNGILKHLTPEILKKDWNLLIAHFLGVDHCGHKYGPYHAEMTRKLNQMNDVIRDITNTIDEDTILIVMGDHGMTQSGDHGGESSDEVTSALFMFSPAPFLSSEMVVKTDVVYQVDFVPTLSALLGFPVPFSNLGKVILEALPVTRYDKNIEHDLSFALNVLQNNIEQMMLYINTYSRRIQAFSKEKISTLTEKFHALKKKMDSVNDTASLKSFHRDSIEFLNFLREMCESVWIQFDSFSMSRGLVLTLLLIFFSTFIVEGIPPDHLYKVLDGCFLWVAYGIVVLCACSSVVLQYFRIVEDMYLFTYVSTLTISIITMAKAVVQHWVDITNQWYQSSKNRRWTDVLSRFTHMCSVVLLFSNSFVVEEGTVLSYLLNATVWLTVFSTATPKIDNYVSKNRVNDKVHWMKRVFQHPKFKQIVLALAFTFLLRLSHQFWRCREEQKWCLVAVEGNGYFSPGKSGNTKLASITTMIGLGLFVSFMRIWLRDSGNLVGFSPLVVLVRYAPNVIVVCVAGFWMLQGLPLETRSKLFVPWQLHVLPCTAYVLIGCGIISVFVQGISVYVMEKKSDSFTVYGHVNIIPQIFHKIKKEIISAEGSEKDALKNNSPLVYGLGTAYSSSFVMLAKFVSLLVILLLGDAFANSIVLMGALTTILLALLCIDRLENTLISGKYKKKLAAPNLSFTVRNIQQTPNLVPQLNYSTSRGRTCCVGAYCSHTSFTAPGTNRLSQEFTGTPPSSELDSLTHTLYLAF
ncbi:UNVERIFIED_CONTAM: hypothetical protein PYX00_000459 [Menopon gallinae]|uniref:GPI ethanolamine phosphate transferase 3, catalytic subunit n=1 Tax=Menopon gallinae TaxID=328185 RepID=A0AAW2IB88_9NEOP